MLDLKPIAGIKPEILFGEDGALFIKMKVGKISEQVEVPFFELPKDFFSWWEEESHKIVMSLHSERTKQAKAFDRKLKNDRKS